jgi:4-hydroxy-3-methylbut-2-enyl diphosphate reductase
MGQLPKGSIDLIQNEDDAKRYITENKKISYVTQTTLSIDDTRDIIRILKDKFPKIKEPAKEDICYATTNRQLAVKTMAPKCDMFFIVGSRNSSNSVRLVEVAKKAGCINAQLVYFEKEIPFKDIQDSKTIGISSGASAPEELVQNLINKIKKVREITIEEVVVAEEKVIFKLPRELN